MSLEKEIYSNADEIFLKIDDACRRSGRRPEEIKITAVSKKQSVEKMGIFSKYCKDRKLPVIFGESYVQEFRQKRERLKKPYEVHLIGALQSNKAKEAVHIFDLIQSVHSEKLAVELNKHAVNLKKIQRIFLQVNISEDPLKKGFRAPDAEVFLLESLKAYPNLRLEGLMTITREYENSEETRKDFSQLRFLRDKIASQEATFKNSLDLSMGMSDDYIVAIEEGATVVRIGTALFGERL